MSILRLPSTVLYDIFVLVQVSMDLHLEVVYAVVRYWTKSSILAQESQSGHQSKHDLRNFAVVHPSWSDPAARAMGRSLHIEIPSNSHLLRNLTQKLATTSTLADRLARTESLALFLTKPPAAQWEDAAHLARNMPILRRFKIVVTYSRWRMQEEFDSAHESFDRLCGLWSFRGVISESHGCAGQVFVDNELLGKLAGRAARTSCLLEWQSRASVLVIHDQVAEILSGSSLDRVSRPAYPSWL